MKEALFYEAGPDNRIRCLLCPHNCLILPEKIGFCGIRQNREGKLYSLIYESITSLALDPIEKKPLYQYHSGEYILSIGTRGCNLACIFCQNWSISQNINAVTEHVSSEQIVRQARKHKSFGIAYTYNEPFIWYEFVLDTAILAKRENLDNVLVTNGYVNPDPLNKILPYIDAMNIDIKSIENDFYKKYCHGSLEPVLATIKAAARVCHIELTNLIIPTLNDREENFTKLVDWIYENLGSQVPLHFSRYFPCYKMDLVPTPLTTLKKAKEIALRKLKYVYLGNA